MLLNRVRAPGQSWACASTTAYPCSCAVRISSGRTCSAALGAVVGRARGTESISATYHNDGPSIGSGSPRHSAHLPQPGSLDGRRRRLTTITSAGNRSPLNADSDGNARGRRLDSITGQACPIMPAANATEPPAPAWAHRVQALTAEARELQQQITAVIAAHAPHLLQRRGVGPDSAAALLIAAGDNPSRMTSEASFAALCGVSPVEASSGKTRRRRLNRGGDPPRQRRALPHRRDPPALRSTHPRLPRPTHQPRPDPPRSHPLRQTLRRPRNLPPHPTARRHNSPKHSLTNIGASEPRRTRRRPRTAMNVYDLPGSSLECVFPGSRRRTSELSWAQDNGPPRARG